jgi:endoglucanase
MSLSASIKRRRKVRYFLYFTVALSLLLGLVGGLDGRKMNAAQTNLNVGFLRTNGSQFVNVATGNTVKITGINWFGLETANYAPHVLWGINLRDGLRTIKNLGYNTIRLPYSNDIFLPGKIPNGIDFAKNPELQGLDGLGIMDEFVKACGEIGLRVFLDRHRPDSSGQSCLWYTPQVPEATMIANWVSLANRYKGNATVIGADLHNEPCGQACWGDLDCGGDVTRDWRLAAERIGNAILQANSDWLIIVEGNQSYLGRSTWFGGMLAGVKDAPVRLNVANKLVYSAHDYAVSVFEQPWFNDPNFPNNLAPDVWDPNFGFITQGNMAPLIVGEFGTDLADPRDRVWLPRLLDYMAANGMSWTFWCWPYNSGDTGGILKPDFTIDFTKQGYLNPYLAPAF